MRPSRLSLPLPCLILALTLGGPPLVAAPQTVPVPPPESPNYPFPPGEWAPNPDYPVLGYGDLFIRGIAHSCQELKDACGGASASDIFDAAINHWLPVGLCTAEDLPADGLHPLPFILLGQTWRPGDHALPWGTGVVPDDPNSLLTRQQRAALKLRQMCIEGKCCCPVLPEEECADKAPVQAFDPQSGACCTLPNRCSIPESWKFEPPFPGSHTDGRCN